VKATRLEFKPPSGDRQFAALPEAGAWDEFGRHAKRLPGALVTNYRTDCVLEMCLGFLCRPSLFAVNNQSGDFWFFVRDPACLVGILTAVVGPFESLLARASKAQR
jgi:hypothetical protein